ncbi:MAG: SprT-like domain-containing protein [Flammeovirgaceae bacterium]
MEKEQIRHVLEQHLPHASVDYCFGLWQKYPFEFKTTKTRHSKVGDFTFRPGRRQQITINADLHPYLFLTTYLHEVAHLIVHLQFGNRVEAHGVQWKNTFKTLMEPVLSEVVFPTPLLRLLIRHMVNPKASSYSDAKLTAAFRSYDVTKSKVTLLSQLPDGSIFQLQKRWFKKESVRRTRALCLDLKTNKKYLVPLDAEVGNAQLGMF